MAMIAATPLVVPAAGGHASMRLIKELRSGGADVALETEAASEEADDK